MTKGFEVKKNYYLFDNNDKPRHEGTLTGVSSDDQYLLAGRSYRCLGAGREVGLFTNSNATEADRLAKKYPSYEGDSVEGKAKGAYFDDNGLVRWKSNGSIPFGDMLLDFFLCGYIDEETMVNSAIEPEKGNDKFWAGVTVKRYKHPETGEKMVRFSAGENAFEEEDTYTNQRSVA